MTLAIEWFGIETEVWQVIVGMAGLLSLPTKLLAQTLLRRPTFRYSSKPEYDQHGSVRAEIAQGRADTEGYLTYANVVVVRSDLYRWIRKMRFSDELKGGVGVLVEPILEEGDQPLAYGQPTWLNGRMQRDPLPLIPVAWRPWASFSRREPTRREIRMVTKSTLKDQPNYKHLRYRPGG